MDEATISVPDAAQRAGVGYTVIYTRLLTGEIDGKRVGRGWRVSLASLERFVEGRGGRDARHEAGDPVAVA